MLSIKSLKGSFFSKKNENFSVKQSILQDLPLCWDQHSKLLPVVNKYTANDVMKWSSEQVAGFVNCLPGCSPHGKVFHDQVIFNLDVQYNLCLNFRRRCYCQFWLSKYYITDVKRMGNESNTKNECCIICVVNLLTCIDFTFSIFFSKWMEKRFFC